MMNKYILSALIVAGIISVGFGTVSYAQESIEIPTWVKSSAGWWAEDKLTDEEYIEGLEFLIDSDIIQLGNSEYRGISEMDQKFQEKFDAQEKTWQDNFSKSETSHGKVVQKLRDEIMDLGKSNDERIEKLGKNHNTEINELNKIIKNLKNEIIKFNNN